MTDDEIIALAHKYIEFDQGKIDGATFNAELAKCRDTGELIAVGTACKMLKGKGLVISSDTPDNPLYDRSKQIERRLAGSVKEDVRIDPLRPLKSWSDLRGMPQDITGDLAPVIGSPLTRDDLEMTQQVYKRTVHVWAIPHVMPFIRNPKQCGRPLATIGVSGSRSKDRVPMSQPNGSRRLALRTVDARPSGATIQRRVGREEVLRSA
jgi:hypothetical protein